MAACCLHNLHLHGKPVTADMVLAEYPNNQTDMEQIAYFKRQCCLNDLPVGGKPVTPELVAKTCQQTHRLHEKALFYAQLALRAKKIHGHYLSNRQVLDAFDQSPGDHSGAKLKFLTQRLAALCDFQHREEQQATIALADQLMSSQSRQNEQQHYQGCIIRFLAMKCALTMENQDVTPDEIWYSIRELRESTRNTCLQFYFLAHCYSANIVLGGQTVTRDRVLMILQKLPAYRLRLALTHWLDELRYRQSDVVGQMFPKTVGPPSEVKTSRPALEINATTVKALAIIRDIPGLRINGSFSRVLQGIGSTFNDVDLLGTAESINTLISRLNSELTNQDTDIEIPCQIYAQALPGAPQLSLPSAYTISLSEGDLSEKISVFQVSVYDAQTIADLDSVEVSVAEGVTVTCQPFTSEIQLLIKTLIHMINGLEALTAQLQSGHAAHIPRTILFNRPKTPQERIFGLLIRCLLTLNKAKQFAALLARSDPGALLPELRTQSRCLHARLLGHSHREPLIAAITQWLSESWPGGAYLDSKRSFIRGLLAMVSNPAELF